MADRHVYPSSVPLGLHSTPARVYNERQEPLVITIVVPEEAMPGTKLEYTAPDGQELSLTVPPNVPPGSLMTLTQELLQAVLTPSGVFFGYLALSMVSLAFVKAVVPETKGKTLEEIERMLTGDKLAREVPLSLAAGGAQIA